MRSEQTGKRNNNPRLAPGLYEKPGKLPRILINQVEGVCVYVIGGGGKYFEAPQEQGGGTPADASVAPEAIAQPSASANAVGPLLDVATAAPEHPQPTPDQAKPLKADPDKAEEKIFLTTCTTRTFIAACGENPIAPFASAEALKKVVKHGSPLRPYHKANRVERQLFFPNGRPRRAKPTNAKDKAAAPPAAA